MRFKFTKLSAFNIFLLIVAILLTVNTGRGIRRLCAPAPEFANNKIEFQLLPVESTRANSSGEVE